VSDDYSTLHVQVEGGICRATIDNPPINLLDLALILDLDRLGREVEADPDVRVLVLDSGNPEFFIAHADVTAIQALPREPLAEPPSELGFFHALVDRFRTMPKITIAVVAGIARGGGCELVSSFDMRFAALDQAVFAQPEVLIGIIPGGSGTQRLPRLVGRARALEMVVGAADVDAATAERWGLVNRAMPAPELASFVDRLATRIASLSGVVIERAKHAVMQADSNPIPGLCVEYQLLTHCLADEATQASMAAFLAAGGQTAEFETRALSFDPWW
jgi:enoyl-CoA hydratase/carnithine racemase